MKVQAPFQVIENSHLVHPYAPVLGALVWCMVRVVGSRNPKGRVNLHPILKSILVLEKIGTFVP